MIIKNADSTKSAEPTKNVDSTESPPFKDIFKDNVKDTLSCDNIIASFYKGIGHKRLTNEKRERARVVLKELQEEGFDPKEIQFAVGWTLKNAKEKPYDFSILKHTMGQAMAVKEKADQIQQREVEEEAARTAEEEKRSRIQAFKEKLGKKERAALRKQAEAEIRGSGKYQEKFIGDPLIEARENEIIEEQLGAKPS